MSNHSSALSTTPSWITLAVVISGATVQILLYTLGDAEPSRDAGNFWTLMTGITWSWWVHATRRRLGHGYAFEFDALVFFAWPIVVPYFLVKSRRALNLGSAIAAWCFYAAPFVAAAYSYAVLT
jgi:hypothetical protein